MKKDLRSAFNTRQYMLSKDFEIFYYNDLHFKPVPLHSHDYYEFYFFHEGNASFLIGGNLYKVKPDDVVLIPPGTEHQIILHDTETPYRRTVFWVSRDYVSYLTEQSVDYIYLMQYVVTSHQYIFHFDPISFNSLQSRILTLLEEIHTDRFGRQAKINLCVNDLILRLNRLVYEQQNPVHAKEQDSIYDSLTAYIDTHLEDDLSLDALAARFYLSKYYISHLFQQTTGISLHQYIVKKRLSACRDAILQGKPINDCCLQFGFKDYSAFYRAFTKEYGISPRQYKELRSR